LATKQSKLQSEATVFLWQGLNSDLSQIDQCHRDCENPLQPQKQKVSHFHMDQVGMKYVKGVKPCKPKSLAN